MERIYLDYAATTPVLDEVAKAMLPCFNVNFSNPSGVYSSAREAYRLLQDAREEIAQILGAEDKEIFFTSGGTESDNWAIKGLLSDKKKHIITTATEHHAIIDACKKAEENGARLTVLPVDKFGSVSAKQVRDAICEDTAVVSVIYANNEVGSVNPIKQIGEVAKEMGVPFHTDAVAAVPHLKINLVQDNIGLMTLSAHKFYGPKGIGVLFCKKDLHLNSMLQGGKQETGKRAGTENVAGAVGMAQALSLLKANMVHEEKRLAELSGFFRQEISKEIPSIVFTLQAEKSLPSTVHMILPDVSSDLALMFLDQRGVECSAGSSCSSGTTTPSHVLMAMGINEQKARQALRMTLGKYTTFEQIRKTVCYLKELCNGNMQIFG